MAIPLKGLGIRDVVLFILGFRAWGPPQNGPTTTVGNLGDFVEVFFVGSLKASGELTQNPSQPTLKGRAVVSVECVQESIEVGRRLLG